MSSPVVLTVRNVDDWTLRCLFNRAHIYEDGPTKYTVKAHLKPRTSTPDFPYPYYALSYYYDKETGDEVARTHHFVCEDGVTIGASKRVDPKRLCLEGVEYRPMKGGDPALRDPSRRYPYRSLGWHLYVLWRRWIKCYLFRR